MDHFEYKPLDSNGNHIRLLRFSDELGSQSGYALDTFDLNECPPYEALSYTWGPPLPTSILILNERWIEIRKNLSDFLEHIRVGITLRDKHDSPLLHPKYLWIDQLCINQSSEEENSHQVRRMAEIYKQAQRVIVWLGRGDHQTDTAMQLIADTWFTEEIPTEHDPLVLPGIGLWNFLHNEHRDYLQRLLKYHHSVENLLHKPYWNRLWVVQEFVLARDILLACSSCAITPAAIGRLKFISMLPTWHVNVRKSITIPRPVSSLLDARRNRFNGNIFPPPELHLIALLRDFSIRKCEDPHDRIYGLLALCNEKVDIAIDYSRPKHVLFHEVFSKIRCFNAYDEWFIQLAQDMGVKQKLPAPNGSWYQ